MIVLKVHNILLLSVVCIQHVAFPIIHIESKDYAYSIQILYYSESQE